MLATGSFNPDIPAAMSYQVIARKYRPQRFADVVGQEHVTTTLANAIASGRIAHAYLFCGPRGTGKTTLARIFAKCLNCTGGPKADFPEDDPRAQEIAEGRALDVLEIDGASNNGVEQVRELRDTARFAPANSKFKIYIIDEVHMLSAAAFNALLKTLEEPPAHVKFLFATTDPEKVLPTILSRCQRFDLRRIPSALIVAQLSRIAAAEGVEAEPAALDAIARGADGGMRDAQSTLDQLISFCGKRLVEADVLSMFGLAGRAQLRAIATAILNADKAAVLREFDGLARGGKDLGRLLGDLLSHFRNLLLWVVSKGDRSLIEASEADIESIAAQAADIDADAITRILDVLSAAEGRLRDAASKRIFLEVALLKAIQARSAVGIDAVLRQLKALREGLPPASASPASAATPASPAAAVTMPAPVAPAAPAKPAAPQSAPAASSSPAPALGSLSSPAPPRSVAAPPIHIVVERGLAVASGGRGRGRRPAACQPRALLARFVGARHPSDSPSRGRHARHAADDRDVEGAAADGHRPGLGRGLRGSACRGARAVRSRPHARREPSQRARTFLVSTPRRRVGRAGRCQPARAFARSDEAPRARAGDLQRLRCAGPVEQGRVPQRPGHPHGPRRVQGPDRRGARPGGVSRLEVPVLLHTLPATCRASENS